MSRAAKLYWEMVQKSIQDTPTEDDRIRFEQEMTQREQEEFEAWLDSLEEPWLR